ncbi:pentatricopeptide repeat-containing protein, partial [Tanacetum coccineum]
NKDNWSWFLELLADDLEISNGFGLTLMSDQHKGLIEIVKEVMPLAEHRQCARHINKETPRSVNNVIDEYGRAASTNHVVFNDGGRIELGKNWNKNKRGVDFKLGISFVRFGEEERPKAVET